MCALRITQLPAEAGNRWARVLDEEAVAEEVPAVEPGERARCVARVEELQELVAGPLHRLPHILQFTCKLTTDESRSLENSIRM